MMHPLNRPLPVYFPFGRYRGRRIGAAPLSYLVWAEAHFLIYGVRCAAAYELAMDTMALDELSGPRPPHWGRRH